jgi:Transposase DDE domain
MIYQTQPTKRQENILIKLRQIKTFFSKFQSSKKLIGRPSKLNPADLATINWLQARHQNTTIKALYQDLVDNYFSIFDLPAYQNFILAYNKVALFLTWFLQQLMVHSSQESDILIVDSTPIPVCHIKRERRHKTMKQLASKCYHPLHNWFYGLKLHILTDLQGNLINFRLTTAIVADSTVFPYFINKYNNKTYLADSAYLSGEWQQLAAKYNSCVLAKTRKNMKRMATLQQNQLLNKRKRVESVIASIKDRHNLVTSLPRSINGYLAHYIRSLFQYSVCDLDKVL